MSYGNLATTAARAFLLAASIVSSGGCDLGAAPSQEAGDASLAPESRAPEVRYQVDRARNRIWVLTADGVSLYDVTKPKRTAISLPDWVWVGAKYGCLPDLALGPRGEAVVTSNIVPTLWTIHPETLAVTVHPLALDADTDKDVGFSGLAYSAEHAAYFAVSSLHGSLWRIDPLFTRAQKIALSEPMHKACGLAVRSRTAQQNTSRQVGLCVQTPREAWNIDLAPDQRSAYVRAGRNASCGIG
jgi:hypothetical protein